MDADTLYIAGSKYENETSEPAPEGEFEVVTETGRQSTLIVKMAAIDGVLTPTATAVIPGYLESQFSMDEYKGCLRLVTTDNYWSHTFLRDPENGWYVEQKSYESGSTNGLYILDDDLTTVGSIEGLAEGERVYSVRFMGDIAYFVTFRETDPLFAADVSDPTNPVILSALKIPGFSEYLHPWSDGQLLGLGMTTVTHSSEHGSWVTTDGMKLSMFDISDPADVTEENVLPIASYGSEALYNHKAILVDRAKNLIAFPADGGYLVYGYDDATGFYERAFIECQWDWNARGLYIEGYFYVVSDGSITVLDLDSLTLVTVKSLAEG